MNQAVTPDPQHALDATQAQRRQRWLRLGLVGCASLALAGYGAYWWLDGRFLEQTDDAYVRADWAPISARVSGYVADVVVADNAQVKAGDLLVRLDTRDFEEHVHKAQARLAVSEAAVQVQSIRLQAFAAEQQEQVQVIARADAERSASQAEVQRAEADWQRYQRLAQWQATSVQRMERARATRVQAQAGQRASRPRPGNAPPMPNSPASRPGSGCCSSRGANCRPNCCSDRPTATRPVLSWPWPAVLWPIRRSARHSMAWSVSARSASSNT